MSLERLFPLIHTPYDGVSIAFSSFRFFISQPIPRSEDKDIWAETSSLFKSDWPIPVAGVCQWNAMKK